MNQVSAIIGSTLNQSRSEVDSAASNQAVELLKDAIQAGEDVTTIGRVNKDAVTSAAVKEEKQLSERIRGLGTDMDFTLQGLNDSVIATQDAATKDQAMNDQLENEYLKRAKQDLDDVITNWVGVPGSNKVKSHETQFHNELALKLEKVEDNILESMTGVDGAKLDMVNTLTTKGRDLEHQMNTEWNAANVDATSLLGSAQARVLAAISKMDTSEAEIKRPLELLSNRLAQIVDTRIPGVRDAMVSSFDSSMNQIDNQQQPMDRISRELAEATSTRVKELEEQFENDLVQTSDKNAQEIRYAGLGYEIPGI